MRVIAHCFCCRAITRAHLTKVKREMTYYLIECDDNAHIDECARLNKNNAYYKTFACAFETLNDAIEQCNVHTRYNDVVLHIMRVDTYSSRVMTRTRFFAHNHAQ